MPHISLGLLKHNSLAAEKERFDFRGFLLGALLQLLPQQLVPPAASRPSTQNASWDPKEAVFSPAPPPLPRRQPLHRP